MADMASGRVRMNPDVRREQIVSAAGRVFAERSYDEVSTTELAAACGISRGLLNHYFATKRDLYLAVLARLLDGPRLPTPAFVEGATVEDRVEESVRDWVAMVAHHPQAWLAAAALLGQPRDGEIQELVDTYVERMADGICEIAGLHDVRAEPEVRVALHGYSAFATTTTRRWLGGGGVTRDQLEQLLAATLVTLVRQTIPALLAAR
ncbi:UNVERIFIED_CONTAM: hypothetical protein LK11_17980 [Mumia flava]